MKPHLAVKGTLILTCMGILLFMQPALGETSSHSRRFFFIEDTGDAPAKQQEAAISARNEETGVNGKTLASQAQHLPPASSPAATQSSPPEKNVNLLQDIRSEEEAGRAAIHVLADRTIRDVHGFILRDPLRLVFDLKDLHSPFNEERQVTGRSPVIRIRHFAHADRVRIVLDMEETWSGAYSTRPSDTGLVILTGQEKNETGLSVSAAVLSRESPALPPVKKALGGAKTGVSVPPPPATPVTAVAAVTVPDAAAPPSGGETISITPDSVASTAFPAEKKQEAQITAQPPSDRDDEEASPLSATMEETETTEESEAQKIQHRLLRLISRGLWLEPRDLLCRIRDMGVEGSPALPAIRRVLETRTHPYAQYRFTQEAAMQALAAIEPDAAEAAPLLLPYLSERHFMLRQAAVKALGQIGADTEASFQALCRTARSDASSPVRKEALMALGRTGGPLKEEGLRVVMDACGDKSHHVRLTAVRILAGVLEKRPEAAKALKTAQHDLNPAVRDVASLALTEKAVMP